MLRAWTAQDGWLRMSGCFGSRLVELAALTPRYGAGFAGTRPVGVVSDRNLTCASRSVALEDLFVLCRCSGCQLQAGRSEARPSSDNGTGP